MVGGGVCCSYCGCVGEAGGSCYIGSAVVVVVGGGSWVGCIVIIVGCDGVGGKGRGAFAPFAIACPDTVSGAAVGSDGVVGGDAAGECLGCVSGFAV